MVFMDCMFIAKVASHQGTSHQEFMLHSSLQSFKETCKIFISSISHLLWSDRCTPTIRNLVVLHSLNDSKNFFWYPNDKLCSSTDNSAQQKRSNHIHNNAASMDCTIQQPLSRMHMCHTNLCALLESSNAMSGSGRTSASWVIL